MALTTYVQCVSDCVAGKDACVLQHNKSILAWVDTMLANADRLTKAEAVERLQTAAITGSNHYHQFVLPRRMLCCSRGSCGSEGRGLTRRGGLHGGPCGGLVWRGCPSAGRCAGGEVRVGVMIGV